MLKKTLKYLLFLICSLICFANVHAVQNIELPIPVFVSIQPQAYFVERIGGKRVSVDVLVLPGKNPATYAPTPGQMTKLSKARLFFRIGVLFENVLVPKIENNIKQLKIIDTSKGIKLRKMKENPFLDQKKEETDDHRHDAGGFDPHIWLDPMIVKKQAKTILDALISFDPDGKSEYLTNHHIFARELDTLHEKIERALAPFKGGKIFVFHPAFGYFADAYGLTQVAVEIEGKAPKGKDLSRFIKNARQERVRVIFVQPQFDQNAAGKIAGAINGVVIPLDPLARDYIKNLEKIAETIAKIFKK